MLESKKKEVIFEFRTKTAGYMAVDDIQETITMITYLFWHTKYCLMREYNEKVNAEEYLQSMEKEEDRYILNINNAIRARMSLENVKNILDYLDKQSEEELIEIICEDYEMYSRYSQSTPIELSKLVYNILETAPGNKVLNMCSYLGSFLLNYAKNKKDYKYEGWEINYHSHILTELKMKAANVNCTLENDNVLILRKGTKYDKIFCDPPFNIRMYPDDIKKIAINNKMDFQISSINSSMWMFVNNVINHLNEKGKAVILTDPRGLFRIQDEKIRETLVKAGLVEAVITLPKNIFYNTAITTNLLVLSFGNESVKFIDAQNCYKKDRMFNVLDVEKILDLYLFNNENEMVVTVPNKKILDNKSSLLVPNYIDKVDLNIDNPRIIEEVATIVRGCQLSAAELNDMHSESDTDYGVINITNMVEGKIDNKLTYIRPTSDKYNQYLVEEGDILVAIKGSNNKISIIENLDDKKLITTANIATIRVDKNIINPSYLKMFLESEKGNGTLNAIRKGTALPLISLADLRKIQIPVPELERQSKSVSNYLAKKDEIELVKRRLEKLQEELNISLDEEF